MYSLSIHVFKKPKVITAQPSHWAENVIFPKLLCSPRYFGLLLTQVTKTNTANRYVILPRSQSKF